MPSPSSKARSCCGHGTSAPSVIAIPHELSSADAPPRSGCSGRAASGTSMSRYNFRENEQKWQRLWDERGCFAAQEDPARPKYYVLEMFSYDWSREIATCHPEYYRHEQKMFLDFLAADLAYRKESWVNWDPAENTVLANEQVIDGRGWRSGAPVEKRLLAQWFLRITAF